jgi:chitinase
MRLLLTLVIALLSIHSFGQKKFDIIAYYSGGPEKVDSLPAGKLTHIIYSFCHLSGDKLVADNKRDSLTIQRLVSLKATNPSLKILLSLGGWGGCRTCSDVFSDETGRKEFAASTLAITKYFNTDGIDLDWEYPAIEGYEGHSFAAEDRDNFTNLVRDLRATMGDSYEISFAAGGFREFLEESVDWDAVMPLVNRVNLMSYDLVNGNSVQTGHHTPLFSTPIQEESTHKAVRWLIKHDVPKSKIVIGAAFYARVWENVDTFNDGLYQKGKFLKTVDFNVQSYELSEMKGFKTFWDDHAQAPYAFNKKEKLFATFDNKESVSLKTQYVMDQKLGGIMFWELTADVRDGGLVDVIYDLKKGKR